MSTIFSIANKVRKQCEIFASSPAAKNYDFYRSKGIKNNLSCMCAIASYTLVKVFRAKGIRCKLVRGKFDEYNYHCWVETCNKIVDITATQFHIRESVYITSRDNKLYRKLSIVRSPVDLRDWGNQRPANELTKKILSISC